MGDILVFAVLGVVLCGEALFFRVTYPRKRPRRVRPRDKIGHATTTVHTYTNDNTCGKKESTAARQNTVLYVGDVKQHSTGPSGEALDGMKKKNYKGQHNNMRAPRTKQTHGKPNVSTKT